MAVLMRVLYSSSGRPSRACPAPRRENTNEQMVSGFACFHHSSGIGRLRTNIGPSTNRPDTDCPGDIHADPNLYSDFSSTGCPDDRADTSIHPHTTSSDGFGHTVRDRHG